MLSPRFCCLTLVITLSSTLARAAVDLPKLTTLSDPAIRFSVPEKPYQVLKRASITAVIVDNREVNDDVLLGHRAGYSGVASLTSEKRRENHFVPAVSGLNFEHIHDGTTQDRKILFEPRNHPMELRVIDEFTVELYQTPTPFWGLESCHRYRLLPDGTIEMTFECIPRRATFKNGYIGLFWASYINQPESLDIHFRGFDEGTPQSATRWIRGVTPAHGTLPTHLSPDDGRQFEHDADFPLSLVFNRSKHRFVEPWYFGVSHGQAYAQIFRPQDRVRLTQSPSGGGQGNPAWDFQFFIEKFELNRRYQFVMRAMLLPFDSPEQVERATRANREALGPKK